jgi:tetratricopeptide (TPR) repeat protein
MASNGNDKLNLQIEKLGRDTQISFLFETYVMRARLRLKKRTVLAGGIRDFLRVITNNKDYLTGQWDLYKKQFNQPILESIYGLVSIDVKNDFRESIENFLELLKIPANENNVAMNLGLAWCYKKAGRHEESLRCVDKVVADERYKNPVGISFAYMLKYSLSLKIGNAEDSLAVLHTMAIKLNGSAGYPSGFRLFAKEWLENRFETFREMSPIYAIDENERTQWIEATQSFMKVLRELDVVEELGIALVFQLTHLSKLKKEYSLKNSAFRSWLEMWEKAAQDDGYLKGALRLLEKGIDFICREENATHADTQRIFLSLPQEERHVVQKLLGVSEDDGVPIN